ncbi:hypothetical protein AND4_18011 [Vibrio sp. AND4]|nr:hypothetical protein AND4_18011 [Vibrio sp. AND4]
MITRLVPRRQSILSLIAVLRAVCDLYDVLLYDKWAAISGYPFSIIGMLILKLRASPLAVLRQSMHNLPTFKPHFAKVTFRNLNHKIRA